MMLRTTHVCHSFGSTEVLTDVDLAVEAGELATVLGRSGCGKTTLLRIVAGLLRPRSGTVRLGDRDITALPPERRRISLVPQEGALFPHLTVAQNVGFGLRGGDRGKVTELLELVGLAELGKRMPHEISGGQAQRVALARALAVDPDLVLLDEPFSALDSVARVRLRAELRRVLQQAGTTAVLVTHDQDEALSLSDRVVLMAGGRVIQTGTPDDVYHRPINEVAARLTGSIQGLPGEATGERAATLLGEVVLHATARGRGMVLLRPEQVRPDADACGEWTITRVTFHGDTTDLELSHGSGASLVARTQRPGWEETDRVTLSVSGPAVFQQG